MPTNFENFNDNTVYFNAKSRNEALKMKEDAIETSSHKNVVIFFENRYHLYLMPGQDPYQLRREIEDYMANPDKTEKSTDDTKSESATQENTSTSTEPKTKKGFFKK